MKSIRKALILPKGYDKGINYFIILLSIFGTLMIGSSSMGLSMGNTKDLALIIIKQLIFVAIGFITMNLASNSFSISFVKSNKLLHLIVWTTLALVFCLAFDPVNGARAWIRLPIGITEISIQPSEFAKITVILIIAGYCGDIKKVFPRNWDFIKRPVGLIAVICLIVNEFQGDFGSMAVILAISVQCFLIPANKQLHRFQIIIKIAIVLLMILAAYILSPSGKNLIEKMPFMAEYQRNRFLSAIDPFYDRYNTGFQLIKGLTSMTAGGWFGRGFGNSINKYSNFPAANTDFILSILIEELGYVGFMALLALYMVLIFRLFLYALRIKKESCRIILIGTATYLLVHTGLNVGGVTGLIPLTGVPLLMISSGGSSTISFMTAIGICQSIISSYNQTVLKKRIDISNASLLKKK